MQQLHEDKENVLSAIKEFAHSVNSNRKVVADMSALIKATSHLSLKNLDFWERLIRWEFFRNIHYSPPPTWKFWGKSTPFLTWLDLCNGDGFKRERTLRSLSGSAPNAFFFALAIRRLNDWVPQVRLAAREKLLSIAKNSNPEDVVDVLFVTFSTWTSWGRMEEIDRQILMDIASITEVTCLLKARILSAPHGPMAFVLSQIGRTDILDAYLSDIAKNAIQPSVRAKAYKCLLENKMVWFAGRKWEWTDLRYCEGKCKPIICDRVLSVTSPFLETLKLAAIDSSLIVRWVAGEILIRKAASIDHNESTKLAELLANDPSPSLAERGKFILKQLNS